MITTRGFPYLQPKKASEGDEWGLKRRAAATIDGSRSLRLTMNEVYGTASTCPG